MLNKNILKIDKVNAFSSASAYVREYRQLHPDRDVISLGIGDVSKPVVKPVIEAMHKAVDDLADMSTFSGYGNYYGIPELRKAILDNEYAKYGFTTEEIYVSDGTKSDCTNILELFDFNSKILLRDPTYPIYRNAAFALSREVYYTPLDQDFRMIIPEEHYDIIFICSPCNPVGTAMDYTELTGWVNYALKENACIIFDNVYKAFVSSPDVPESIYEIPGARKCAIELRSFSKTASFTGLRCSYFVLPKEIDTILYKERTINRFNGASYVAQKGAVAVFLPESQKLISENIRQYKENIAYLRKSFEELGFEVTGGMDSPYIWVRNREDISSFDYFKKILNSINVIIVPGAIFGTAGDGYFRVSGLGTIENSRMAMERFRKYYEEKD
ncbi:MAG: LL-diaminopimelate aminotransferase [Erysipelotrichaceae bacterium]|nr:LL-diaminopimelate aminotransferase [Erysipelotrichaceae bacterium]